MRPCERTYGLAELRLSLGPRVGRRGLLRRGGGGVEARRPFRGELGPAVGSAEGGALGGLAHTGRAGEALGRLIHPACIHPPRHTQGGRVRALIPAPRRERRRLVDAAARCRVDCLIMRRARLGLGLGLEAGLGLGLALAWVWI